MKSKVLPFMISLGTILLVLTASVSSAQGWGNQAAPYGGNAAYNAPPSSRPPLYSSVGSPAAGSAVSAAIPRYYLYQRTFGVTEAPFIPDANHLHIPQGVGVDASGNLWVAESARAMKYTPDGTFLMSIDWTSPGWPAGVSHLVNPHDVAVDGMGNIWVVDFTAHRVVKFDAAGKYLMHLGMAWNWGTDNSMFNGPTGVAFDSSGNIYISDYHNQRVQVFDSAGTYITTIGENEVTGCDNAHFNGPYHVAIDDADNLYVVDIGNHRVQIFNASHAYVDTLGVCGEPGSDNDHFNQPFGVTVDASRIYVSEGNNRIQVFDRATRTYQATLGIGGGNSNEQFEAPNDIVVDAAGNLYVADQWNHRVQKYNSSLAYVRTFGTTGVPYLTDSYHYNQPVDVAVTDDGGIAILEGMWGGGGDRLVRTTAEGEAVFTIGTPGIGGWEQDQFNLAMGVAFDPSSKIYVADCANHRVQIFPAVGEYEDTLGTGFGTGEYEFDCPSGVAIDGGGNIYVTDANNHRLQIFNSSHTYLDTLGVTGVPGWDKDHFNWPNDVDVDASGNIYVADTFNHVVKIFDANRVWLKTVGGFGLGNGQFWEPFGVAVDSQGNLFVGEKFTSRVQVFDSDWNYRTTIGGGQGILPDQFSQLYGVDVDAAGNVYIADTLNHRVQKYAPSKLIFLPLAVSSAP